MKNTGLVKGFPDNSEPVRLVEVFDPGLGVQDNRAIAAMTEGSGHELVSEALASIVGRHNETADRQSDAEVCFRRWVLGDHSRIRDSVTCPIPRPQVNRPRVTVDVIEFLFRDALLQEEDVCAKLHDLEHVVGAHLRPGFGFPGHIRHSCSLMGSTMGRRDVISGVKKR
jgi:hypothetical protein